MLAGAGIALLHWYATAGAFAIGALVLLIGRTSDTTRLLLAGVVLASACGAVISVLLSIAGTGQLRGMVFWLAGDLSWSERPGYDLAVAGIALIAAVLLGRVLNVLASGELRSASLGLAGAPTRLWVFLIASALTGTAVLSAGPVGFVGLVAPHLVRLGFKTADHRIVAPAAALCGGALLCVADVLSRTVAAPRQLPIGAVMALIGAPVFIVLLRRQRSE
jgi:iron complex transport system permease protein